MTKATERELGLQADALEADIEVLLDRARRPATSLSPVQHRLTLFDRHVRSLLQQAADAPVPKRAGLLRVASNVWAEYRRRIMQRTDRWYSSVLGTADELAWNCASSLVPDPDLLPLTSVAGRFGFEAVPYQERRIHETDLEDRTGVDLKLPVGWLEIPVATARLVHHLGAIPHEAGHLIERSAPEAAQLVEALPEEWAPWASEVFADLVGLATSGGAFAAYMLTQLADLGAQGMALSDYYPPLEVRGALLRRCIERRYPDSAPLLPTLEGTDDEPALPCILDTVFDQLADRAGWSADREAAALDWSQGADSGSPEEHRAARRCIEALEEQCDDEHARRDQLGRLLWAWVRRPELMEELMQERLRKEPPYYLGAGTSIEDRAKALVADMEDE